MVDPAYDPVSQGTPIKHDWAAHALFDCCLFRRFEGRQTYSHEILAVTAVSFFSWFTICGAAPAKAFEKFRARDKDAALLAQVGLPFFQSTPVLLSQPAIGCE
jgi:hypothetical protein